MNEPAKDGLDRKPESAYPAMGVGMAWDIKRGGGEHDVRAPAARDALWRQLARTHVAWWAPECRSFSRARGRPIPGATSWPGALRSEEFPYGLPNLKGPKRNKDREKVLAGNEIAEITAQGCREALATHSGFAIENPARSFFWQVGSVRELADMDGVSWIVFSNCLFEGGVRNKQTGILTNVPEIVDALKDRICKGSKVCDRTHLKHETWTPKVLDGEVQHYQTAEEAEYPEGLCIALAVAVTKAAARMGTESARDMNHDATWEVRDFRRLAFTEVFSGPRAPLTQAVISRLAGPQG